VGHRRHPAIELEGLNASEDVTLLVILATRLDFPARADPRNLLGSTIENLSFVVKRSPIALGRSVTARDSPGTNPSNVIEHGGHLAQQTLPQ
jgi:hypothetical protein